MSVAPILIIGGGIAGLTAALALLRRGMPVSVYEQAASVGDVGAGISLGATATRGLVALGLQAALNREADRPTGSAARHFQTGEILGGAFAERDYTKADFSETHMIHRADLFALLREAVEALDPDALHFGPCFTGFTQDAQGVRAMFADGREVFGACLLGCDGIRSAVRAAMFGATPALKTGQVAYRFLVPEVHARPYLSEGTANLYVGPRCSLLHYAIRHGTLINCIALVCTDAWEGEGWSQTVPPEELQTLFAGWHPDPAGLAAVAPEQKTAKWALFDRDPLDQWVQGRVALVGDAAHPMLPFLGMGAAMGIEDAVVLARSLEMAGGIAAGLQRYQAARAPRAGEMLLESRRQSRIFAAGPGSEGRLHSTAIERMNYDPATVPL